jgi:hypothetical protein
MTVCHIARRSRISMRRLLASACALALVLAVCGGEGEAENQS